MTEAVTRSTRAVSDAAAYPNPTSNDSNQVGASYHSTLTAFRCLPGDRNSPSGPQVTPAEVLYSASDGIEIPPLLNGARVPSDRRRLADSLAEVGIEQGEALAWTRGVLKACFLSLYGCLGTRGADDLGVPQRTISQHNCVQQWSCKHTQPTYPHSISDTPTTTVTDDEVHLI